MPRVVCPGCGAIVQLQSVSRSAEEFCNACDFPLFWADGAELRQDDDASMGLAVRRRPGTGGRQLVVSEDCPVCQEPNRPTAVFCQRCGAEMHPPPPPRAPPEPPPAPAFAPPPPAPVPTYVWWRDWWLLAALIVLLVLLIITVITVIVARR
ncbi:MAG: zinc-ribbon domain-containing protein [Acidimicrobiales bacterium]